MEDLEFFMNAVVDPKIGKNMEYRNIIFNKLTCGTWERGATKEFGRLIKGLPKREIEDKEILKFISVHNVLRDHKVTYAKFCCYYRKGGGDTNDASRLAETELTNLEKSPQKCQTPQQ